MTLETGEQQKHENTILDGYFKDQGGWDSMKDPKMTLTFGIWHTAFPNAKQNNLAASQD